MIDVTTSRMGKLVIVGVLCLGAVMTVIGSSEDAPTLEPLPYPRDHSLSASEHAYLAFMVPRVDRLIDEAMAVSSLVDERSRNIIALRGHGNRIAVLTADIVEWEDSKEVPVDFVASHVALLVVAQELDGLIDAAQSALVRLDFADVGDLIPRFNKAVAEAHVVQDALHAAGGSPS